MKTFRPHNEKQPGREPFDRSMSFGTFVILAFLFQNLCWASEKERILFLTIELTGQSVQIVETVVRPGRLKSPSPDQQTGEFQYELLNQQGRILWQAAESNPLNLRYEYVDSLGNLNTIAVPLERTSVMIRVPFIESAHSVRFLIKPSSTRIDPGDSLWRTIGILPLIIPQEDQP
jgi:hypothetical protein